MITVRYRQSHGTHRLAAHGHAGHASRGSDIVCAAASILLLTAADLLGDRVESSSAEHDHHDRNSPQITDSRTEISLSRGSALLRAPVGAETDPVFDFTLRGLALIARKYPDAVRICEDGRGRTRKDAGSFS